MGVSPSSRSAACQAFDQALVQRLGADQLVDDDNQRHLFGQDIFHQGAPVGRIVRPLSVGDVVETVRLAGQFGMAVIGRGGGMSYTGGYLTSSPQHTVMLDMSALDRVVEVNADDMYVVVEAGCTWSKLDATLRPMGLRAAYWGPISGLKATIGGAISQNAIFFGSGTAGTAADTVLGVEVVTGTGEVLTTGSLGVSGCNAFFRQFGPDITGLFTADCGALGIKTRLSLRLVQAPGAMIPLSFAVPSADILCRLMSRVARAGLAAQQMALDQQLKDTRLHSEGLWSALGHLWQVWRQARSAWAGLRDTLGIAASGRNIAGNHPFSLHLFIEAADQTIALSMAAHVRRIAAELDAIEVAASIPKVMAATPFAPLNGVLGPKGERWVPMHCIIPHSRAGNTFAAITRTLADHRDLLTHHKISTGFLFSTCGTNGFVIEPMCLWPDAIPELHKATVEPKRLDRFEVRPDNPEGRAAVAAIRTALGEVVDAIGAVHIQVGRHYPYRTRLNPAWNDLLTAVRAHLDPMGIINPGVLEQ